MVLIALSLPTVFPSDEADEKETLASIVADGKDEKTDAIFYDMLDGDNTEKSALLGEVEWNFTKENQEKKKEMDEKKEEDSRICDGIVAYSGDFRKDVLKNFKKEELKQYRYLIDNFYHVDATTRLLKKHMKFEKLFEWDLSVANKKKPIILIYHTHSQEGYRDSRKSRGKTVVDVGDELTRLLEEDGIKVLHHKGEYDKKSRDTAYSNALPAIEKILEDNPQIEVVIDLHRDGVGENTRLTTTIGNKKMAQIMFFNGVSYSRVRGNLSYLKNDNLQENLAFSLQMQLAARTYYPTLTRNIYVKGYRYNMHLRGKTLLVEVGAQTNTYEEAKNAMVPLAALLSRVLKEN